MEVKPVGRERDRQIAEMRGIEVIHVDTSIKGDYYYKTKDWKGKDSPWKMVPRYSTVLTDAWKLWEEMKKDIFTMQLIETRNKRTQVALGGHWNGNPSTPITFKAWLGEDEADAISGAWVKWKGEDNENQS